MSGSSHTGVALTPDTEDGPGGTSDTATDMLPETAEILDTEVEGANGSPPPAPPGKRRKRRRWPWVLLSIGVVMVLIAGGCVGLFYERQRSYDKNMKRIDDAFPGGNRPSAAVSGAQNWLLVGSDRRPDRVGGEALGQRSDTLMLMHIPKNRKNAQIISFPRDAWVTIPGKGKAKINAAYSWGGPKLLISTVEQLTNVRIDHFGVLDFDGFKSMTDALGGVDVRVDKTVRDPHNNITWNAGVNHLSGEKALKFVRQRYGLANGDFDRIKRQQAFLKALADKSVSRGTLTNPFKLNSFLEALTKSVSVDKTLSIGDLRSLALSLRSVRTSDLSFMTTPTSGTGFAGGQSIVRLNEQKGAKLYDAVRNDKVDDYLNSPDAKNNNVDEVG